MLRNEFCVEVDYFAAFQPDYWQVNRLFSELSQSIAVLTTALLKCFDLHIKPLIIRRNLNPIVRSHNGKFITFGYMQMTNLFLGQDDAKGISNLAKLDYCSHWAVLQIS